MVDRRVIVQREAEIVRDAPGCADAIGDTRTPLTDTPGQRARAGFPTVSSVLKPRSMSASGGGSGPGCRTGGSAKGRSHCPGRCRRRSGHSTCGLRFARASDCSGGQNLSPMFPWYFPKLTLSAVLALPNRSYAAPSRGERLVKFGRFGDPLLMPKRHEAARLDARLLDRGIQVIQPNAEH